MARSYLKSRTSEESELPFTQEQRLGKHHPQRGRYLSRHGVGRYSEQMERPTRPGGGGRAARADRQGQARGQVI